MNRRENGFTLTGLALGYFIVLLDTTIVTIALPAIQRDLGGGLNGLAWVSNAYTMVFASLLLGMGSLSDRLGAKRVFLSGLILFMIASVVSAAAPTLGALITLRALLGIGGAAILPSALAVISHTFTDPMGRARALGIWAAVSGAALAAGPVIGGVLVDSLGWRSIFLLNIPIVLISYALTRTGAQDTPRRSETGFDPAGQLTGMLAIAALTFGLMQGDSLGWNSPIIICVFASAFILLLLFGWIEKRGSSPMLPFALFRNPTVSAGMAAGFIMNFGLSGTLFIMALYFQEARGYSAMLTGLAFLSLTLPMAVNPMLMSRIVGRFGASVSIGSGMLLAAAGTLILSLSSTGSGSGSGSGYAVTGIALFLVGYGTSLVLPALVSAVISAAPPNQAGIASGALNAIRQLGATFGVALFGLLLNNDAAFMDGFRASLLVSIILLLGGSFLAYTFIRRKTKPKIRGSG